MGVLNDKKKNRLNAGKEVKEIATEFFVIHFNNQFGYVTEKRERIAALSDDCGWVAFQMIHPISRRELWYQCSDNARSYLVEEQLFNEDGSLFTLK